MTTAVAAKEGDTIVVSILKERFTQLWLVRCMYGMSNACSQRGICVVWVDFIGPNYYIEPIAKQSIDTI